MAEIGGDGGVAWVETRGFRCGGGRWAVGGAWFTVCSQALLLPPPSTPIILLQLASVKHEHKICIILPLHMAE